MKLFSIVWIILMGLGTLLWGYDTIAFIFGDYKPSNVQIGIGLFTTTMFILNTTLSDLSKHLEKY